MPTPGGVLPLRLGRDLLARPRGVGLDILPGHVQHRVTLPAMQGAARALRVAPVGAGHPVPPGVVAAQRHPARRLLEDHRAGHEHLRLGARIVLGVRHPLGDRHVAGGVDKAAKGGVGDLGAVDPEAGDAHRMGRGFLRVVVVRTHEKGAARDPDHVLERSRSDVRGSSGTRSVWAGCVDAHCCGSCRKQPGVPTDTRMLTIGEYAGPTGMNRREKGQIRYSTRMRCAG